MPTRRRRTQGRASGYPAKPWGLLCPPPLTLREHTTPHDHGYEQFGGGLCTIYTASLCAGGWEEVVLKPNSIFSQHRYASANLEQPASLPLPVSLHIQDEFTFSPGAIHEPRGPNNGRRTFTVSTLQPTRHRLACPSHESTPVTVQLPTSALVLF